MSEFVEDIFTEAGFTPADKQVEFGNVPIHPDEIFWRYRVFVGPWENRTVLNRLFGPFVSFISDESGAYQLREGLTVGRGNAVLARDGILRYNKAAILLMFQKIETA